MSGEARLALDGQALVGVLVRDWGVDPVRAAHVVAIAATYGVKAEPVATGYVTVRQVARGRYVLEPNAGAG